MPTERLGSVLLTSTYPAPSGLGGVGCAAAGRDTSASQRRAAAGPLRTRRAVCAGARACRRGEQTAVSRRPRSRARARPRRPRRRACARGTRARRAAARGRRRAAEGNVNPRWRTHSTARRAMSLRSWLPSNAILCAAVYAAWRASSADGPSAVTFRTRPPAVTIAPLDCVASDILGVSGRAMLDALVSGTTDPEILAELARGSPASEAAAAARSAGGSLQRPARAADRRDPRAPGFPR